MFYCLATCIVIIGVIIGIIHNSAPYLSTECVLLQLNCPIIKSSESGTDRKEKFDLIAQSMQHWIQNGEEIATQINIRIAGEEAFNFYAADSVKTNNNFDDKSLCAIFSNTKTFTALLIAIAIDKEWINSYNDPVTKYWHRFPTNKGKYNLKIKDILRHEGGLCVYAKHRVVYDVWNINADNYDIIRKAIEAEEIFYYQSENGRCYHTISRGHILNEIFHLVEPKKRYMAQYYEEEILPILMQNDSRFALTFRGLSYVHNFGDQNVYNNERSFDVESPPYLWSLYHVKFAKYILKRAIISDEKLNGIICKYLQNTELCPKQDMTLNMTVFEMALDHVDEMHESGDYRPKQLSKYFRVMVMEHMSASGLANAHSMAKTFEYILNNVISEKSKQLIFSEPMNKFDVALGINTSFTIGGLGYFPWAGIEWYGWFGWGGSLMLYSPKYDCFVAYTVNAFTRQNYAGDPRKSVIVNLLSQHLLAL